MAGMMMDRTKYMQISAPSQLAYWMIETGGYFLANFGDGVIGLCAKQNGGCWGVITPELEAQMRRNGWLDKSDLTYDGMRELQRITGVKWAAIPAQPLN